jgi:dimethylhistidine N-methyltransferase
MPAVTVPLRSRDPAVLPTDRFGRAREPRFVQMHDAGTTDLAAELAGGLLSATPAIAPKFFYDELGAHLFVAITALPEYMPTRTEAAIFAAHRDTIAAALGQQSVFVDLGAGDCEKAAGWFGALAPRQYVAIDIAAGPLRRALDGLQRRFPQLDMLGVGADFTRPFDLPPDVLSGRRVLFYPGSSIGNFTPDEAVVLLHAARRAAGADGKLLIGVDLIKDPVLMERAYDDALGVTAAFNLNVLRHVNRVLGTDFDVGHWRHVALYNELQARIEMHLEARDDVVVRWPGGERRFAAGTRIHTENSYKYRPETFVRLLASAGWTARQCWLDDRAWFAVVVCE